ncbi:hypothetical protein DRO55_02335 [Candidatus Bathyarchaeota archaeon]|nr:MAG: hypothetical protein DRO55_02335 [Candidatus Bathyarchaeota archaeon]
MCQNCYNHSLDLCTECSVKGRLITPERLPHLGMALIMGGIFLIMAATVLSASGGEGIIVIFPFILGRVTGLAALLIMALFMILSFLIILLPWILGPRRMLRLLAPEEREEVAEVLKIERGRRSIGEIEEYLITLKMPGFREEDIHVETFADRVRVEAESGGRRFERTYRIPRGFEPVGVKYNYEDGFLLVKVTLRYVGEGGG